MKLKPNLSSAPTSPGRWRGFVSRRVARVCALAAFSLAPLAWAQTSSPSRLINLSVRSKLAAGESLIAGFILTGTQPVRVLVRAVGPGLVPFGVTDAMPNPKIALIDTRGAMTVNDDWTPVTPVAGPAPDFPTVAVGAFPLPAKSHDAALLVELPPGAYTLQVSGSSSTDAGTVLAEVYDARADSEVGTTRLVNLSVRGIAGPGAPMLSGFVVSGTTPKRMLLRVSGPALTNFGVAGAVADTRLDLMDHLGAVIRSNDNWDAGSAADTLDVRQATTRSGAFSFLPGSRDAAVVVTLPPGLYTLRGSGVDGVSGVVLLEMYELQD